MMKAILLGPFVGELYWEFARFSALLPYYKFKKYKKLNVSYIILTREERFDLYGKNSDILVPMRIPGDYEIKQPNCFRLDGYKNEEYLNLANNFKEKYNRHYEIVEHVFPDISKTKYIDKHQFSRSNMIFEYKPRQKNYNLIDNYIPSDKPIVILAPRFRNGFKRNWNRWPEFYDKISNDEELMKSFSFIICGKPGEYVSDIKKRFYDMNDISLEVGSSLVGLLLVLIEKSVLTIGSQSAIPNIALIYKKDVLEFGCQKTAHTKNYNVFDSPITFIEDKKYEIEPKVLFKEFKKCLKNKKGVLQ